MFWQDKYTCDQFIYGRDQLAKKLEHKKDEEEINRIKKYQESNTDYLKLMIELLAKQYIYNNVATMSIDDIECTFRDLVENESLINYIKELSPELTKDKTDKILKGIEDSIKTIRNGINGNKIHRIFFNVKPVIIYKSEIEQIQCAGNMFGQHKKGCRCKQPAEWAMKYLFVWLVLQKAYSNKYSENPEWTIDKEEELRKYAENDCDSGQRVKRFEKLISNNYISYDIKPALNLHKDKPQLLYKINFLANDGEKAFEINNFKYIWEHYLIYSDSKKYGFCEICGDFIEKKHKDKRLCETCQKIKNS